MCIVGKVSKIGSVSGRVERESCSLLAPVKRGRGSLWSSLSWSPSSSLSRRTHVPSDSVNLGYLPYRVNTALFVAGSPADNDPSTEQPVQLMCWADVLNFMRSLCLLCFSYVVLVFVDYGFAAFRIFSGNFALLRPFLLLYHPLVRFFVLI